MKCVCGNDRFYANQICYHNIIVNDSGTFEEDIDIYDSQSPYGPYTCTECGMEYEELD